MEDNLRSPAAGSQGNRLLSIRNAKKVTDSQFLFDQTSGRHYILREIETESIEVGSNHGKSEPKTSRDIDILKSNSNGGTFMEHDKRVTGKMNYRQRQAYAQERSNDRLKASSPNSLLRRSAEKFYIPRIDKLEGYS